MLRIENSIKERDGYAMQLTDEEKKLVSKALQAREYAYVPYSGYAVGAALLTRNGQIYSGCNIENAAYGPTNCAERTAFFKAVSEGEKEFRAIAVAGSPEGKVIRYAAPCGVCRQVMMEFCDAETFKVILVLSEEEYQVYTLEQLLPMGFGPKDLCS